MNVYFCTLIFVIGSVIGYRLPAELKGCKRSDPKRNQCLKKFVEDGFRYIEKGVPEINFPNSQPIKIESLTIREGPGVVRLVQNYRNIEIYDILSTLIVDNINSTFDNKSAKFHVNFSSPEVYLTADYEFNGQVLGLPIIGEGKCKITMKGVKAYVEAISETFEKKNKTFLEFKDFTYRMVPERMIYRFDNLFHGDEKLGNEMNYVLNENWKPVYEDVQSGYELAIGEVFKSLLNILARKLPYVELFPL